MRGLILVALAACSGGAKTTIANHGGAAPKGPPPSIAWAEGEPGSFTLAGLPAIAADGSRVAIGYQGEDGARGMPNLTLIVKDRKDATIENRVVLEADPGTDTPSPKPDAIDAANRYLADSHQQLDWRPLAETGAVATDDSGGNLPFSSSQKVDAGDVEIRFDDKAHLVIAVTGKPALDQVESAWLVKPYQADDVTCENPPYLSRAWIDGAQQLTLLWISYGGNDTCWEPDSEAHVVAW